jgi:hypothetical protein
MSKKPDHTGEQAIENLKHGQKRHISGTHPAPFLTDPAEFRSGRSSAELAQSQKGQLIATPLSARPR